MQFELVGLLGPAVPIAVRHAIHALARLRKRHGGRRWRKMKAVGTVRLRDGTVCSAELHWYEAHGIGRREMKIKRLL